MTYPVRAAALLLCILVLSACGQSGPLYLPGNPSEVQEPSGNTASQRNKDEAKTKVDDEP